MLTVDGHVGDVGVERAANHGGRGTPTGRRAAPAAHEGGDQRARRGGHGHGVAWRGSRERDDGEEEERAAQRSSTSLGQWW
jgi:hypothetical protein